MKLFLHTPVKFALCLLTLGIMILTSCHKNKNGSDSSPFSKISGLKAFRHRSPLLIGMTSSNPFITWNFSGTNPIFAIPTTDTAAFGHQELSFTGSNVTQIGYYSKSDSNTIFYGITAYLAYNVANQIDTVSFQYTIPQLGKQKIIFEYNGDKISKAKVVYYMSIPDTFTWATPDIYTYTYVGNNISNIDVLRRMSTDHEVYTFVPGNRKNNLGGSFATYLAVYFLQNTSQQIGAKFLLSMPIYTNPNIVDSTGYLYPNDYNPSSHITTITDNEGRITRRIYENISPADTVYYGY